LAQPFLKLRPGLPRPVWRRFASRKTPTEETAGGPFAGISFPRRTPTEESPRNRVTTPKVENNFSRTGKYFFLNWKINFPEPKNKFSETGKTIFPKMEKHFSEN
jgi:hypothetical protein